ncbi:MAG: hypothetical protein NDI94_05560 [Candidatus Woesearchaeota archaeon]|nr:hypothetical protein [Candidatus Woesearchaeota archaeon]
MAFFTNAIFALENLGLLDVLLPFILIFTIAFAVLQKSKILGPHAYRFNVMVGFVIGLAAVIPHVIGRGPDVVVIINAALPNVSLLMVASMMVLLLIGVFGNDINIAGTNLASVVVLFSIIAVGYTFVAAAGYANLPTFLDQETIDLLIALIIFGVIVNFITADPEAKKKDEGFMHFFKGMGDVLGKGGGGHGEHH